METLRNVFLKVDAHEMHFLVGRGDVFLCVFRIGEIVQWDAAIRAKRHVVLRNLVILRHVRIEIVFTIEFRYWRDAASEHQSGKHRHAQRVMIHHRQGAGHTEADWTRVRIWLRSKLNRRSAKHFRARLELDVYFQADRCDVVHATQDLTTNEHESTRIRRSVQRLRLISVHSCLFVVIALQRVIERALQIEFFDPIREDGIVCGVDDALSLEKIKETSLRNHLGDLRVIP